MIHLLCPVPLPFHLGPRLAAVAMSDDMKPAVRALLEAEYSRVGHDPASGKPAKVGAVHSEEIFQISRTEFRLCGCSSWHDTPCNRDVLLCCHRPCCLHNLEYAVFLPLLSFTQLSLHLFTLPPLS